MSHATSRNAAEAIRTEGFDLGRRRFGRLWGNGINTTPEPDGSANYASLFGNDAVELELRVNVSRVLHVALTPQSREGALRQILISIPGGYARFVELTIELRQMRTGGFVRPEALTRAIIGAGYDAIEIV